MNNNYGYTSPSSFSSFSSPYSSTPTGIRAPPRPRFAYSGPSSYPRPRSSASKPNPDSFSDSMANNYAGSTNRMDSSFESRNNFSSSYLSPSDNSSYFSANDTFFKRDKRNEDNQEPNVSMSYPPYEDNNAVMDTNNGDYQEPRQFQNRFQAGGAGGFSGGAEGFSGGPGGFSGGACGFSEGPGDFRPQRGGHFQPTPTFQQSSSFQPTGTFQRFPAIRRFRGNYKQKNFSAREFGKARMDIGNKRQWRCDLCSIDFTSQIPLDMHLRGAKHAKKLKSNQILNSVTVQAPVAGNGPVPQVKELYCELCNVQTNSSLQLQTHLDGNKHKNKLKGDAPKEEGENKTETIETQPKTQVNGNGSLTRTLPSDFGEPQPSKLIKFSCDICNVFMNSSTQFSQHMNSKKHQAKVEGKPLVKGKKAKEAADDVPKEESNETSELMDTSAKDLKTVMGVQNLSTSFVQSGTLE